VAISDDQVPAGNLPSGKMKLVQAWFEIHRDALMAVWRLAVQGIPPQRIPWSKRDV